MATTDLPRMQHQPRRRSELRRELEVVPAAGVPREVEPPGPVVRRAPMMRQYELVERVRNYNPHTN